MEELGVHLIVPFIEVSESRADPNQAQWTEGHEPDGLESREQFRAPSYIYA